MQEVVVIIGDSLGAPRPWVGVDLKRTYALQLAAFLGGGFFVANYSTSDNSSERSVKESFLRTYVRRAGISFAIIHLGIVDCAPRLLSNFERLLGAIASRNRFFNFYFKCYVNLKSRHRYWLTKRFPRTLVPLASYEANFRCLISALIHTNPIKSIYLLEVAYPGNVLLEKSFNILGNINAYNDALHRIAMEYPGLIEVIGVFEQTKINPDWITQEDGHHILPEAHDWIAWQLQGRIKHTLSSPYNESNASPGFHAGIWNSCDPHAE